MTPDERLNLRARQLLDDATLSPNQRLKNAAALLQQLRESVGNDDVKLSALLAEITDPDVKAAMQKALTH